MFLSIIIPIYNDEKFLNECLDSCLDQDYPNDDYEIICVDDGSTDRSPVILKEYADRYTNIHPVFVEHGHGGRNTGYPIAKGDYIWFVDHDDIVAPNAIPELKHFVEQNPKYDRYVFPIYQFENEMSDEEKRLMALGQLRVNDLITLPYGAIWSSIYSHSFLLEHDILPWPKQIAEAKEFWGIQGSFPVYGLDNVFNLEFDSKGGRAAEKKERPLYHYRIHGSSESGNYSASAKKNRQTLVYNRFLFELFQAIQYKMEYTEEKEKQGAASPETTGNVIHRLRLAIMIISPLPAKLWRKGIKLAEKNGAFFKRRPPELQFSYRTFLKMQSKMDLLRPKTYLQYFLYTKGSAYVYRIAMIPWKILNNNAGTRAMKRIIKRSITQE